MRAAWDFGSGLSSLSRKQRTLSRLKRAAQIPNDSRSRFRTSLFTVWLKCVDCVFVCVMCTCVSASNCACGCMNYVSLSATEGECILLYAHKNLSESYSTELSWLFFSRLVGKPAGSFAVANTHTHTHKVMDVLCEMVFSRRDKYWMLIKRAW